MEWDYAESTSETAQSTQPQEDGDFFAPSEIEIDDDLPFN